MGRWTGGCGRHHALVLLVALLLAAGSIWLAANRLGVTTDTGNLFSASLPWRQRNMELQKAFPHQQDLLVAVVDGATPEEADQTAAALADALAGDKQHFRMVTRPDASPYLQRNAFLFLDKDTLTSLLNQTIDAQPFLGQLAADPSLRGLLSALSLIAQGVEAGQAELGAFTPALAGFHAALAQAAAGRPEPLSWERLLAGSVADLAGKYRFVLTQPVLNYGELEPGAAATAAIRATAADLEFVRSGRARVRLTGSVALDDEEFSSVANGAVVQLLGSMALVAVLLFIAVRTWRMVVRILITLVLGLLLTTGFAALAVGTLNLVSVAFAVLFTGIAVDFAIQFTVRFREAQMFYPPVVDALTQTGRRAGAQILVAALASMAGFIGFTPTSFVGVAQLGLIAGSGMLIAFFCTITFLPALLAWMPLRSKRMEFGVPLLRRLDPILVRWHRPVVILFVLFAVFGVALLPRLEFDSDPLHTKNPNTEAVRTLYDLMDDPITNPYTIDILTPSLQDAAALGNKIKTLPLVQDVLSLNSFVPEDQDEKLPLIEDAASLLRSTLNPGPAPPRPDAAALRASVQKAEQALAQVRGKLPADSPIIAIIGDLGQLAGAPDNLLLATDQALTRFLPMQLDRLRDALEAKKVTAEDVPPEIRRDWVLPDGRAKLQVVPKHIDEDQLAEFVSQVEAIAPNAAGAAVTIVGSAQTITDAFRTAALLALAGTAVLLLFAMHHVLDMALVLAPLIISSLLTVVIAVLLPLPLNFANIIALPLLLGVGVSFNVYFVMNWRARRSAPLGSATARAVLFSALTTSTAFGSLALSRHPGTASMGDLLLLSLGCTLLTTMIFLPALLAWLGNPAVALKSKRWLQMDRDRRNRGT
ncbi:MAG TPA: MMPL family transporter [Acetobacteraceae bacterium]|nr:MMPL family transporter [Acetobacteraceae bacterium]